MMNEETYRGKVLKIAPGSAAAVIIPGDVRIVEGYETSATILVLLPLATYLRVGTTIDVVTHGTSSLQVYTPIGFSLLATVAQGKVRRFMLTNNSTPDGVWRLAPERTKNTARDVGHNRGTSPQLPPGSSETSPSCPRLFTLIPCDESEESFITSDDFSDYIGGVVTITEESGCWTPEVYEGPEPDEADVHPATFVSSASFCNDAACEPCGAWGALDDFVESGSGPVIPVYSEGSWAATISRNTGAVKEVTASLPPCPLDLTNVEAFTLSFDVTSASAPNIIELVWFTDAGTVHKVDIEVIPDGSDFGACPVNMTSVSIRLERSDGGNPALWVITSGTNLGSCPTHEIGVTSTVRTDAPGDGAGFDFDEWRIQIYAYCEIDCSSTLRTLTIENLKVCWEQVVAP